MAKNRPPEQSAEKATLIVAHVALLDQWHSEIMNKTDMGLRVLIFHGVLSIILLSRLFYLGHYSTRR